jgi:hypothetical protein
MDMRAEIDRLTAELEAVLAAIEPFANAHLVSWGQRSENDDWFHVNLKLKGEPRALVARAWRAFFSKGTATEGKG